MQQALQLEGGGPSSLSKARPSSSGISLKDFFQNTAMSERYSSGQHVQLKHTKCFEQLHHLLCNEMVSEKVWCCLLSNHSLFIYFPILYTCFLKFSCVAPFSSALLCKSVWNLPHFVLEATVVLSSERWPWDHDPETNWEVPDLLPWMQFLVAWILFIGACSCKCTANLPKSPFGGHGNNNKNNEKNNATPQVQWPQNSLDP